MEMGVEFVLTESMDEGAFYCRPFSASPFSLRLWDHEAEVHLTSAVLCEPLAHLDSFTNFSNP